jgi:hypothetical protein
VELGAIYYTSVQGITIERRQGIQINGKDLF